MRIKSNISKSLSEVWNWKEQVYQDIKNKTYNEKKTYFQQGMNNALKTINGRLKKKSDGSYIIIQ